MRLPLIIFLFFYLSSNSYCQDLINKNDSLFIDSINKLNLNNKKLILFENKYNEAIDKFNLGKLNNAISLLDECVSLDSTSANSYFLLSKCYYDIDLKFEFLHNIKKALFFDSLNVFYISEIGNYYRSISKNDSANFYFNIIIENFPNFSDVFYWKSLINIKNQDYSNALDNMNKAINIEEKDFFFHERAGIYRKQKNFNKSLSDYKICIKMNNKSSLYYNNIASLYKAIGILDSSIYFYNKSITLDKQNKLSFNNRGEVFLENGDIDNAKKDFKKSLEIDSSYTLALNNLSVCFYNSNDLAKTIELLNKCIEIHPDFVTALINRGIYYQTVRNERKACEDWNRASKLGSELAKKFINNDCY
ncbi:MAG: hypothetical protein CMP71_04500 [Flavobacteriales bacterium]|nr:hypothetical protein [Flavobacteriales bacterium]|tara:strand:- start:48923 stop:50008 length:1086 start_codon:yes stop_codon:yes gene_type:complete